MGDYFARSQVLANGSFHGVVWMLLSVGIIGNILVVVWRLCQKTDQRSSPLSILIIMLAISDFFYCIHLLLLQSLVTQCCQGLSHFWAQLSTRFVCLASGCLSIVSCYTAQFAIFLIAVYSFQAITETCYRCCCSLLRKRCLIITIIFQILFVSVAVLLISLPFPYFSSLPFPILGVAYDEVVDNAYGNNYNSSRSEQITQIFGRCAFAQSNGYGYCYNDTYFGVQCETGHYFYFAVGTVTACLSTAITVVCAVLYLLVCVKVRKTVSQTNMTERSDIYNLQLRLSVIVLLNTCCWIPATVLHWISIYDFAKYRNMSSTYANASTAASILIVSISPAVNPIIYTLTGKDFLRSIRKYWRQMKCAISLRQRNSSNFHDDRITGIERCSCIPCVKCVHRFEDFDTPDWNTDRTKLLESVSESGETT